MIKITENAQKEIIHRIYRILRLYQNNSMNIYEMHYELREMLDLLWYSYAMDLSTKRRVYKQFCKKYFLTI